MIAEAPTTTTGALIAIALTIMGGTGSVIGLLLRGIIKYLFDRIAVLEAREKDVLTKVVATAESQQESINEIVGFVTELAKDRDYARRRASEGGQG